jgi:hypothetical protein
MPVGHKRTIIAQIGGALGFACGVIGLLAGLTGHTWKLEPIGWFTGGTLLALLSLVALVDGAIASLGAKR